jgi:hypothetical protein
LDALTNLDRYAEWNPQIPVASGTIEGGRTNSVAPYYAVQTCD